MKRPRYRLLVYWKGVRRPDTIRDLSGQEADQIAEIYESNPNVSKVLREEIP